MAYLKEWPRTAAWPERRMAIPLAFFGLALAMLLIGHWRYYDGIGSAPAARFFDGLPVSGSWTDARSSGFTQCTDFNEKVRCRRANVSLLGYGPFSAAVDLLGGKGQGGFRELTLWHDYDADKAVELSRALEAQGWHACRTMLHNWGDQDILTHPNSPVRISIDLSYYGKRRVRVIPGRQYPPPKCE